MKTVILHILCEGSSEERFVKTVLAPYLSQYGIYPKSVLLTTSRSKGAHGGMTCYAKAHNDLALLIKQYRSGDNEVHLFTTMFDYYALPDDFPGFAEASGIRGIRERIACLEDAFLNDIGNRFFIPYIQLHEFESLLFSDIEKLAVEYPLAAGEIEKLKRSTDKYGDPEMINNSPETAPSKRIIKALGNKYNYNKVKSGAAVTAAIGMDAILSRCLHFREWVERIIQPAESLRA